MYAKPSSLLDSQAPNVLVADYGFLSVGITERRPRTAEGTCNRLPMSVAFSLPATVLVAVTEYWFHKDTNGQALGF